MRVNKVRDREFKALLVQQNFGLQLGEQEKCLFSLYTKQLASGTHCHRISLPPRIQQDLKKEFIWIRITTVILTNIK